MIAPAFTASNGKVHDFCETYSLDLARVRQQALSEIYNDPACSDIQPAIARRLIDITAAIRAAEAQQSSMEIAA